jgi:hypothetical protein
MTSPFHLARSIKPALRVHLMSGGTPKKGTIGEILQRGQPIQPSTPTPSAQDIAAARADTRVGNSIVNQRLDKIVPESDRVVGGTYTAGAPNGGRWADLPPSFLNKAGVGFKLTPQIRQADMMHKHALSELARNPDSDFHKAQALQTGAALDEAHKGGDAILQHLWEQAVNESSQAAKHAVANHNVRPLFKSKDWDAAMSLPFRDHLWYELSGEKMAENLPDLTPEEYLKGMDLVGATSARAEPGENLERALGSLSQHMRNVPVDVDLTIPSTVNQALSRSHSGGSSALPGNKTGHFSDTLALTGGVPTRFPISVNDVWVGRMFGVPDDVMSSNQSLHEPMALYFNKIRDMYNKVHGHELPFKYQSWNFQAPSWVHLRNEPSGDAYHQVWGGIINKLKAAGVEGIEGDKITRKALLDPKFADALRRTTPEWRAAHKATVEFGTTQSNVGAQAAELYRHAVETGDQASQKQYLKALTTAMYHSARGKNQPWEILKKAVTGDLSNKSDITRISAPTSDDPFSSGGTFEGAVSPNIRVPLKGMSPEQIAMMHAVIGKHLKQDAMAASVFHPADPNDQPREGHTRGHSLFVPTTDKMDVEDIRKLANGLSAHGHDMSFTNYPNGYMFDVIPRFDDQGNSHGIDHNTLRQVASQTLGNRYPTGHIMAHDFSSVYNPSSEYAGLKRQLLKGIRDDFISQAVKGGASAADARKVLIDPKGSDNLKGASRKAWDTYRQRLSHLATSETAFKQIAKNVEDAHRQFIDDASKRFDKAGAPFIGPLRRNTGGRTRTAYKAGGKVEGAIWHENDAYDHGGSVHANFIPHGDPRREANLDAFDPIRDEHGAPRVFYHGTRAKRDLGSQYARDLLPTPDIKKFKTDSEFGAHFGTKEQSHDTNFVGEESEDRGQIYPVHLRIKNPIRLKDLGRFNRLNVKTQLQDMGHDIDEFASVGEIKDYLKSKGYDGIVYLNRREGLKNFKKGELSPQALNSANDKRFKEVYPEAEDSYIAFDPQQIKSALGNSGEFDPTKPNIHEAHGGAVGFANGGEIDTQINDKERASSEHVTAPVRWQSAPDHPPTKLAYITDAEAALLKKLDLHGSGVRFEDHHGPHGVPSYDGTSQNDAPDSGGGGGGIGSDAVAGGTANDTGGSSGNDGGSGNDSGGGNGNGGSNPFGSGNNNDTGMGGGTGLNFGVTGIAAFGDPSKGFDPNAERPTEQAVAGGFLDSNVFGQQDLAKQYATFAGGNSPLSNPDVSSYNFGENFTPLASRPEAFNLSGINMQDTPMTTMADFGARAMTPQSGWASETPPLSNDQTAPQQQPTGPSLADVMGTNMAVNPLYSGMSLSTSTVPNTYTVNPKDIANQVMTAHSWATAGMTNQQVQDAITKQLGNYGMSLSGNTLTGDLSNPDVQSLLETGGVSPKSFAPVTATNSTTNWGSEGAAPSLGPDGYSLDVSSGVPSAGFADVYGFTPSGTAPAPASAPSADQPPAQVLTRGITIPSSSAPAPAAPAPAYAQPAFPHTPTPDTAYAQDNTSPEASTPPEAAAGSGVPLPPERPQFADEQQQPSGPTGSGPKDQPQRRPRRAYGADGQPLYYQDGQWYDQSGTLYTGKITPWQMGRATGGRTLYPSGIVEHVLAKISAPPPALDPTKVATRGRP